MGDLAWYQWFLVGWPAAAILGGLAWIRGCRIFKKRTGDSAEPVR
jgi:hypothetical protein